jgi:hypothetical protein
VAPHRQRLAIERLDVLVDEVAEHAALRQRLGATTRPIKFNRVVVRRSSAGLEAVLVAVRREGILPLAARPAGLEAQRLAEAFESAAVSSFRRTN